MEMKFSDVILGTLCGGNPTRIDTFGNVASLIFKSDNIQQPTFNGFIVRVNASVEGELVSPCQFVDRHFVDSHFFERHFVN
jgi:hypothetical protein